MLAIVIPYYNPCGFTAPLTNLYHTLEVLSQSSGFDVFVSECVFGSDSPLIDLNTLPIIGSKVFFTHTVYRSNSRLWQKEAIINRTVSELPKEYTEVLWLDSDITFTNPNFVSNIQDVLCNTRILQPYVHAQWLDHNGNVYLDKPGVAFFYGDLKIRLNPAKNHPGFAWAARREFFKECGGLFDLNIIGGGDISLTHALWGELKEPVSTIALSDKALIHWRKWAEHVYHYIGGNVGYIDSYVRHRWHGNRINRRYIDRVQIVSELDPDKDLVKNEYGMLEWSSQAPDDLKKNLHNYFKGRLEDGKI